MLLRHLLRSEQLLDLGRFLAVELVLETLVRNLVLSFGLGLELLVLRFSQLFLLRQVVTLLVEKFSSLTQQIHLYIKKLDFDLGGLNLLPQFCCLFQRILVILQG